MSYPLLAVAWDVVRGRPDISNIVQEIVGQHVGDLALLQLRANVVDHVNTVIRIASWIRLLFDLQRTYPVDPGPDVDAATSPLTSILSTENILSCMLYLLDVKSKLFPPQSMIDFETAKFRYHLAFTLLSGVRVLLLRNDTLTPDQKGGLKRSIGAAWNHPNLPEDEKFLVFELLPTAISHIKSAPPQPLPFDLRSAGTPSQTPGNHYFNLHPDKFVPATLGRLGKFPLANLDSFWVLFDSVWAGESSLIKIHLDNSQSPSSPLSEVSPDNRSPQSRQPIEDRRRSLITAIMQPPEMTSTMLNVLQAILANVIDWEDREGTEYRIPELQDYMKGMQTEFEESAQHLVEWLKNRANQLWACNGEMETLYYDIKRSAKCWVSGAASVQERLDLDEHTGPIYVLSCPALHPIPHKLLAKHLRNIGSACYEELLPVPNFMILGSQCPRCPGGQIAQSARLVEPIENLMSSLLGGWSVTDDSSSRFSKPSNSAETSSKSGSLSYNTSHSSNRGEAAEPPQTPLSAVSSPAGDPIREQREIQSLDRLVSPLTPTVHYGSLPQSLSTTSLPPAQPPPTIRKSSATPSAATEPGPIRTRAESTASTSPSSASTFSRKDPVGSTGPSSVSSFSRKDPRSRIMLGRRTASIKAKPSKPTTAAPPSFAFSTAGDSVLIWGGSNPGIAKLDLGTSAQAERSTWYNIPHVQFAAAGNHRSAVIATDGVRRKLITVIDGDSDVEAHVNIDLSHRPLPEMCVAVSRDDKHIALTLNDDIHIFHVQSRRVRRVVLQDRDNALSSHSPNKNQSIAPSKRALSWKEVSQETARQNAVQERKLNFTMAGDKLIVATHLADQHVYLDIWEINPDSLWSVKPDYNRFFKLPPWTTNDGDLTSVFYDSLHRSAFLTAFLGKTYPLIVPIPGYDNLHPDDFSPRTICAAQSPSGIRYATLTSLLDLHLFDYKANGTLSPRRVKKATSKIPSAALKVGHVGLAMPSDSTVLIYWTKDTKLMLRTVALRSEQETITDRDLRADYERVVAEYRAVAGEPFDLTKPSFPSIDDGAAELMGKIDESLQYTMSGALPEPSSPRIHRRGTLGSRRVIELDSRSVQELPGDYHMK